MCSFLPIALCVNNSTIAHLRKTAKPQKTKADKEHARDLIKKYGQNPSAYLTLEEDKLYYFGKTIEEIFLESELTQTKQN